MIYVAQNAAVNLEFRDDDMKIRKYLEIYPKKGYIYV